MITLSERVLRRLPQDENEANVLVNEILEQALLAENESPEDKLENRPDWQEKIARSRQQWIDSDVVTHEDVLSWKMRQT